MRLMGVLAGVLVSCVPAGQVEVRYGDSDETAGDPDVGTAGGPVAPARGAPTTEEEVCAVRDAITATLRGSTEDWAAAVADETAAATCSLDADGTARIGSWTMVPCDEDCDGTPLRFIYRREGAQVPSYAAQVEREGGGYTCTDLGQFMVVPGSDVNR